MSTKDDYVSVKRRDLDELQGAAASLGAETEPAGSRLRNACQAARVSLDRIIDADETKWQDLQPIVDADFRRAYDCLQRMKPAVGARTV